MLKDKKILSLDLKTLFFIIHCRIFDSGNELIKNSVIERW